MFILTVGFWKADTFGNPVRGLVKRQEDHRWVWIETIIKAPMQGGYACRPAGIALGLSTLVLLAAERKGVSALHEFTVVDQNHRGFLSSGQPALAESPMAQDLGRKRTLSYQSVPRRVWSVAVTQIGFQ